MAQGAAARTAPAMAGASPPRSPCSGAVQAARTAAILAATAPSPPRRTFHSNHRVPKTTKSAFKREAQSWDVNHHHTPVLNEMKPKDKRAYFSRPQSLPELHVTLHHKGEHTAALRLVEDEIGPKQEAKHNMLSADGTPPVIPHKHRVGGMMANGKGDAVPWNDRWHAGVHQLNDSLHPSHRQGFSKKSVFEDAPSQRWRRHAEVQVSTGVWRPHQASQPRFGPMGV